MNAPRQRYEGPSPRRTLTEWAIQTHLSAPAQATRRDLQDTARGIYDRMAPHPTPPAMSPEAQRQHIGTLQRMHASARFPFTIAPQSHDRRAANARSSPQRHLQRHPESALTEFAYRFRPQAERARDPQDRSARLTVNINPAHARAVSRALGGVLSDPQANPTLRALKVMGPARIGQRVDDAVLYLRGHDESSARALAGNLQTALQGTPHALVEHGPPGMLRIAPGISYAETVPGDSTSHGSARKKIVARAVEDYRSLGGAMSGHVGYRAFRAGYNPLVPSHAVPSGRADLMRQVRSMGGIVAAGGTARQGIAQVRMQDYLRERILARRAGAHY